MMRAGHSSHSDLTSKIRTLVQALSVAATVLYGCKHVSHQSGVKVIGGVEDGKTPLPVIGLLGIDGTEGTGFCTGAVVRHDLVITAAHCIAKVPTDKVVAYRNWEEDSSHLTSLPVSRKFIVFPGYDPKLAYRMNVDVAFLVFPAQTFAAPIAKFASKPVNPGELVALVGYGDTGIRDDASNPQNKRFVGSNNVQTIDSGYGDAIVLTTSTVGMTTAGAGQGDSGGALFNAQGEIVGIAHVNSFSLPDKPSKPNNDYIDKENQLYSIYLSVRNPGVAEFIAAVMADSNPSQVTVEKIKPTPIKVLIENGDYSCSGNRYCKDGWGWLTEGQLSCSSSSPQWKGDKKGCSCRCSD